MNSIPSKTKWSRTDTFFFSKGTRCAAWLYLPQGIERPPVVIMAHGFAGERSFGLEPFAERFASEGLAVFVFDYRNFGDSEGEPRNLVDPFRHLADWKAAIRHVRSLKTVDAGRIGLWGSSFSGGHVIMAAAADSTIRAISAQVPYVDPISTFKIVGIKNAIKGGVLAICDLLRAAFSLPPLTIPIAAPPGKFAALNTPDSLSGFLSLIPEGKEWRNECPARVLLIMSFYSPISKARHVRCPALIIMAEQDSLIDKNAVAKAAARMPRSTLIRLPVGHFDVYKGEAFERVVAEQVRFFLEHLS